MRNPSYRTDLVHSRRIFFTKVTIVRKTGQTYLDYVGGERRVMTYPERYMVSVYHDPGTSNEHLYTFAYTGSLKRAKLWGHAMQRRLLTNVSDSLGLSSLIAYCIGSLKHRTC